MKTLANSAGLSIGLTRVMRRYLPVVGALLLIGWAWHRMAPESAPVARGAAYAATRGCVECHGDTDGPLADHDVLECPEGRVASTQHNYEVSCADAMAYFEVIRLRRSFDRRASTGGDNLLIAGERLAREYHCFQCHGQLGQGGFDNKKAFKGYVPGYFGSDFRALTRNSDPESVRQWIMYGMDSNILDEPITGPIAGFFFDRQAVNMPSYKSLNPAEIEILVSYVLALHALGPMTATVVRQYSEQSNSMHEHYGPESRSAINRILPGKENR